MDSSKHRAVLRLLGDPLVTAQHQQQTLSDSFLNNQKPLIQEQGALVSSLSMLTSRIGAFLEDAKKANAPPPIPMEIEIDEEEMYNEDDDDDDDEENEEQSGEKNEDLVFDHASLKFVRRQRITTRQPTEPQSKKRKVDLIRVVNGSNNCNDNDDDDDDGEVKKEDRSSSASSSGNSSSSIDIVTFSSDDEGEGEGEGNNDGIDLSNLSGAKRNKLIELFSGARMMKKKQKELAAESHGDDDDDDEEEDDEDDGDVDSNPLKGKMIQMNVVAGVFQEDPELAATRFGSLGIAVPTPAELLNEQKRTRKNRAKLSKLIEALVSE